VELVGPLDANLLLGLVWLLIGLVGLAAFTSTPPASRGYLRGSGVLFVLLPLGARAAQPLLGLLPLGGALPLHAIAALAAVWGGFLLHPNRATYPDADMSAPNPQR